MPGTAPIELTWSDGTHTARAIVRTLGLQSGVDDALIGDISRWFERWEENVRSPSPDAKFLSDNAPGGSKPMRSLREVETQVNIWGRRIV